MVAISTGLTAEECLPSQSADTGRRNEAYCRIRCAFLWEKGLNQIVSHCQGHDGICCWAAKTSFINISSI